MIEEFVKLMDSSIEKKIIGKDYLELIPIGSYSFNIFNEEENIDKNCEVLVFDSLKNPYEQLIEDLEYIFKKFKVSEEGLDENKIDLIYNYILNEIFGGYDLDIGFNEEDIKDIITYYELTGEKLEIIEFEGREEFNIGNLVDEILEKGLNRIEEAQYIKTKWEDKSLGWSIYFNNDFLLFNSEIDREMRNRFVTQNTEKPKVKPDPIDYEKLSLYKIKELNPKLWRKIYDEVYDNYKNEDGYYVSASGMYASKSKRYFQIDHIVPLSKGGLTKVENLQLLTRWENAIKGDSMTFELKGLEEIKELEDDVKEQAAFDCLANEEYEDSLKIIDSLLDDNKESISALNMKAKIALESGSYTSAISQYHKILDINENMYDANFGLGWLYSRNRRYKLSNKYYEKASKIEPECSSSLNNIGRNYFKLGDYERALEYYEKALEIHPDEEIYINNIDEVLKKLEYKSKVQPALF